MADFIYRANIDHYLELLYATDLATSKRGTILKLLIEEEDKLARYQEQLEFAEIRLAKSHDRVNHFRDLRDGFADGSDDRKRADSILENIEALHQLLDQFCHRIREQVKSRGI